MSEEKGKQVAGAITYPQNANADQNGQNNAAPALRQPQQPTDLQGLLRYAVEATKTEDAPRELHVTPLDNERKQFLENALKSMAVEVVEILQSKVALLENAGILHVDSDITQYTQALETISDYVDHIDIANDFHKIGGFRIFLPCFRCARAEIRAGACEVLADLCQNNPYCQRAVLDAGLIPSVVKLLATDESRTVAAKALYAISCIVRHNAEGFAQFVQYEGLAVLLAALQKDDERIAAKTAFLLTSLCATQPDLIGRLVFLEYVPVLIGLVAKPRTSSHEHVLSLLLLLATENSTASCECKNPARNFEDILRRHLEVVAGKEEYRDEEDCCQQILKLLFPSL